MAKLIDRAVESEDFVVARMSQTVLNENQVFDGTTGIIDLEADKETRKPLKIEFDLDQIEDSE